MPINPYTTFPCFDPANPLLILDIPDNITHSFGSYIITFRKADKKCRIYRDATKNKYNGDYGIYVNGERSSDRKIVTLINEKSCLVLNDFIRKELIKIATIPTENDVYSTICSYSNQLAQDPTLNGYIDLIQMALYYGWHRCQIEDRAYPQQYLGQNGRIEFLNYIKNNI